MGLQNCNHKVKDARDESKSLNCISIYKVKDDWDDRKLAQLNMTCVIYKY